MWLLENEDQFAEILVGRNQYHIAVRRLLDDDLVTWIFARFRNPNDVEALLSERFYGKARYTAVD